MQPCSLKIKTRCIITATCAGAGESASNFSDILQMFSADFLNKDFEGTPGSNAG